MSNKSIFKKLLCSVQKISSLTSGKELDENLINKLKIFTPSLMSFFDIGHFESIVLSIYIDAALRELPVEMDRVIDHFGKDISVLADIHESVEQLRAKKIIVPISSDNVRKPKSIFSQQNQLSYKALDAIIQGDSTLLFETKVNNFLSLLSEVKELLLKRIENDITTDHLVSEIRTLLEANKNYTEVEWLLSFDNLDNYDLTILLAIALDHMQGEEDSDLDQLIKDVFSRLLEQISYKKRIKENANPLFLNGIIEYSCDMFIFMNYVKLTEESMEILLGGYKDATNKVFIPKMGSIIQPNQISLEDLYYNDEEKEQIDLLTDALDGQNYLKLMSQLKENGMKEGFTVLLHGYPGTGKTSSVKQIAKATGRNIFLVEIDKIQSKWVGDSEKNIAKIFDEYKKCKKSFTLEPILLFNEADAILGKRFNVSSSIDKSFNTIQNMLLQELEDFEGIFMATTNLANQLDQAFDRRLLYKIEFKKPIESVRKNILTSAFKNLDKVMIDKIKQYSLTGGQISNMKKKLFVHSILKNISTTNDYLLKLCEEELSLSRSVSQSIGFKKY